MGRWEQREAVVAPGIAAADIGWTDRAIDRTHFPERPAAFLALTLSKLYVRLLRHCRTRDSGVGVGGGDVKESKRGKAGCPGAKSSPRQGGPGAVKGKGRGGRSGARAEAAVWMAESFSVTPPRAGPRGDPRPPRGLKCTRQGGAVRSPRPLPGGSAPARRDR